jgi:hypothetical protein
MGRTTIGVIVDNGCLARWQADALRTLTSDHDFIVYNCLNSRPGKRRLRHALYYLLNLGTVRNAQTRRGPMPSDIRPVATVDFESAHDGSWQSLPDFLIDRIRADQPKVLVKFGMGLLTVPPETALPTPILSYHHGDPSAFRGRPAGFYELLTGAERMGQVIQTLSNELDAGAIAAFAETKIHRHSYRATLVEAYRASPLLLRTAIAAATSGKVTELPRGKAYRLPGNGLVTRFCLKLFGNLIRRFWYGAFVEKKWQVAEAVAPDLSSLGQAGAFPLPDRWSTVPTPRGYTFIADPFYHPEQGILIEGLATTTGHGEILHLSDGTVNRLLGGTDHWSYPATLTVGDEHFILPEQAEAGGVELFRLADVGAQKVADFRVAGSPRLIDPTLLDHDGIFYLFGNRLEEGGGVLRLWTSHKIIGPYEEHPCSPIRISPAGGRMGGLILADGPALIRVGQDYGGAYGDGVILFAIERLTPTDYRERQIGSLRFDDVRGPHTINIRDGRVLFDFYRDRVTPLAGLRRLRSRLARG